MPTLAGVLMSNKEIPIFKFGSLEDFDFQLGGLENANLYITSLYNWGNPDEETKHISVWVPGQADKNDLVFFQLRKPEK